MEATKKAIAHTIKGLVDELQQQIENAESAGLTVRIDTPSGLSLSAPEKLSVQVFEQITY